MAEEHTLYKEAGGSPLKGYLLLKSENKNVPPNWVERYTKIRRDKHEAVTQALHDGFKGYATLCEWEEAYLKECFYYGIRILFELEREGKSSR